MNYKPKPPLQFIKDKQVRKIPDNTTLDHILKMFPDCCHKKISIASYYQRYDGTELRLTYEQEIPNPKYENELAQYTKDLAQYHKDQLQNAENNLKMKEKEFLKSKKRLEDLKIGINSDSKNTDSPDDWCQFEY